MGVPVLIFGQGLIDTVVEVLVVGEDNVAANIVQLQGKAALVLGLSSCLRKRNGLTKPSGVTSVEARPPAFSLESTINQEAALTWCRRFAAPRPVGPAPITRTSTLLFSRCQYGESVEQLDGGGAVCKGKVTAVPSHDHDEGQWVKQLFPYELTCQPFCFLLSDLWW